MRIRAIELLLLSTAIGIVATFAAPWMELGGTYAAWRIVEWHTFWRGESAFLLGDVVAANYQLPIEFVTAEMQDTVRRLFLIGGALGIWHGIVLIGLLIAGARLRLSAGASRKRVALEIIALVAVNAIVFFALTALLALPSSLTPKVDFRMTGDIHTDSLIWSSVNILPVAPVLSLLSALLEVLVFLQLKRQRSKGVWKSALGG